MNIIKFKDSIKVGDELFNDKFRGKYCWWVNCKWAISFDDISADMFVELSENNEIPGDIANLPTTEYHDYVDIVETERINNQVNTFQLLNENTGEIPIDKLKCFRTWLAQSLIDIAKDVYDNETDSSGYDYETDTMLNFYANNMSDGVVKALTHFSYMQKQAPITTECACNINPFGVGVSSLSQSICNAEALYRDGIYNKMVSVFGNIGFWKSKVDFLPLVIKYLRGILNAGLPLKDRLDLNSPDYRDCTCVGGDDTTLRSILTQLIQAMQYIVDGQDANHKNFIFEALNKWSIKLYEKMYWV